MKINPENLSEIKKKNYIKKRREALDYIKKSLKQKYLPSYYELNKKFGLGHLKITLLELYQEADIKFLNLKFKRPNNVHLLLRKELIDYIKERVKYNHHPSRREIENKFNLSLAPVLFKSIRDLYKKAGIKYSQENNQELKVRKAKLLTDIVISILPKLDLKFKKSRRATERGIDILAKDYKGKMVGIEIKAYNKYERVKERNIEQIKKSLEKEKLSQGILITTTDKIESNLKIPKNIKLILFKDLRKIFNEDYSDNIHFIRNYSIHEDTSLHKKKREIIINYVRNKLLNNKTIKAREINKELNLDVKTYFNSVLEIYLAAGTLPPLGKFKGPRAKQENKISNIILELWRERIKEYIKFQIKYNHYPSGVEIGNYFNNSRI